MTTERGVSIESLIELTRQETTNPRSRMRLAREIRTAIFGPAPNSEDMIKFFAGMPHEFWLGIFYGRMSKKNPGLRVRNDR